MVRRIINKFLPLSIFISLMGCTGTKQVPVGEKLYTGAEVKLVSTDKIKNKKQIIAAAKSAIKPKPNQRILGMRPKLVIYHLSTKTKKKGLQNWLQKYGEPPVLLSSVNPNETSGFIDAKLFNNGIFKGITEYKIVEKKNTAKIIYTCHVHKPYTIKSVEHIIENEELREAASLENNKTLLVPGSDYNLDKLKKERERIDIILKDNGYFFFNPDYFLFKADTSESDKSLKLQLTIKDEAPNRAVNKHRINNTYIDPNYSLERERDSVKREVMEVDGVYFLNKRTRVRPKIILQSIYLKKNELYSRKKHNITLNRLMTLGTFKFVKVKLTPTDTNNVWLDLQVLLTPMPKRTLRAEVNLVSKSNDFVGPQLNVNYRNRNALNGAELLNISLGGSFETQFSGKYKNLYSYSINPRIELFVPRFIVPFPMKTANSLYVPKTKFALGYNYLKRIGYFDLTSLQFIYGFKWKEDIKKEHELNPININFTSVSNKSPEFQALLESNPFIKKSYEEQFIAGATYSFTLNEQVIPEQKNQFYFNVTTETSGNLFSAVNRLSGSSATSENPSKIAGSIYSQFAKLNFDARNYTNLEKNKLVLRLYAGVAKPYGNSSILPYIKQFFSGGPNSIRAFPINSLGPGTYADTTSETSVFTQQGGDVKLETNAEYRFDIYKFIKGAVFIDAGNIWLLKSNPAVLAPPFSFTRFHKELAVGTGIGLRIDVSFFVLRFDLAMPLRKPWLPENERWVIDKINFGSYPWRSDNLLLNVAIGYPF